MPCYPIMLNVAGMVVVVVGGGRVGRRKVQGLLAAGASVRVVDPAGGDWPDGAELLAEPYAPGHLAGAKLVFACTNDRAANARIAADARAVGALVNVADDARSCDFTVPAVHRRDGVTVAVAAEGAPAVAAALRDALAAALPEDCERFARAVAAVREKLKAAVADADRRGEMLNRLSGPEGLAAFRHGGQRALEELLDDATK